MKKLVALSLVLMALLFSGCGGKTADTTGEGSAHGETTQTAEGSHAAEGVEETHAAESAEAAVSPGAEAEATAPGAVDTVSGVQQAMGELEQAITSLGQSIGVLESVE